jgi:LPS sulfotransferase NodH
VCSLITALSGCFSDADHSAYIAEHWQAMLEESIRRVDVFRALHPEHPIVDIQYDDLVRDPVATVASIYESIGDRLDDETRETMTRYAAAHPRGSLGVHGYTLAQHGLDAAEISERFSGYVNRYNVAQPPARELP